MARDVQVGDVYKDKDARRERLVTIKAVGHVNAHYINAAGKTEVISMERLQTRFNLVEEGKLY
jgi:outer membrane lipoprotein SlyB